VNKQQIVANMVKEGTHTRQEILEKADCTPAALAGYFSSMRNAAQFTDAPVYPVEKEIDGRKVFTAMTFEDAEARRAQLGLDRCEVPKEAKSPKERYEAAVKRVEKCINAANKAVERFNNNPESEELKLRSEKAEIEFRLAQIGLGRCEVPKEAEEVEEYELMDKNTKLEDKIDSLVEDGQ